MRRTLVVTEGVINSKNTNFYPTFYIASEKSKQIMRGADELMMPSTPPTSMRLNSSGKKTMKENTESRSGLFLSGLILFFVFFLFPSYILCKAINSTAVLSKRGIRIAFRFLRRVKINEIRPFNLSLHGISFYGLDAEDGPEKGRLSSISDIYASFRTPTIHNPYFATFLLKGIRHFGPLGSGQCCTLTARVRFPRKDQTWVRLRIDDLRVTVRDVIPPLVVDRLRENLLRAVVLGEVMRLNEFIVTVDHSLIWAGQGISASAKARGYEVNVFGRIYDFGCLKADLLRRWRNGSHGRFSIHASHFLWRKKDVDESIGWTNLTALDFLCYPHTLISSISSIIQKPSSLFDIQLITGELNFRKFRHRDQALLKHALQFAGEWKPQLLDPGFIRDIIYETIADFIFPPDNSSKDDVDHISIKN